MGNGIILILAIVASFGAGILLAFLSVNAFFAFMMRPAPAPRAGETGSRKAVTVP